MNPLKSALIQNIKKKNEMKCLQVPLCDENTDTDAIIAFALKLREKLY